MPETLHDSDLDDAFQHTRFVPDPSFKESLRARLHAHQRARTSSSPPSAFSSNGWRRLLFTPTDPSDTDEEDDPMNNTSRLIPAFAGLVVIALVAALLMGLIPSGGQFGSRTVLIDDFESGTLDNWTQECIGSGCWFVSYDGSILPDHTGLARTYEDAATIPWPIHLSDPPQGSFAAMTNPGGPGMRIIYRDFELDAHYRLHLTVYYVNVSEAFFSLNTLSAERSAPNQQYRIDLLDPSSPVDSLSQGDVLASVFRASSAVEAARLDPMGITFDLSPWTGQTVRLRIAQVDNWMPLRAGVDNIYLEPVR